MMASNCSCELSWESAVINLMFLCFERVCGKLERVKIVTCSLRKQSCSTSALPISPVPPVNRIFITMRFQINVGYFAIIRR